MILESRDVSELQGETQSLMNTVKFQIPTAI